MPAPDPISEAAWGDAPPQAAAPATTPPPVAAPAAQTAPAVPPAASNVVPLHPIAQAAGPVAPPAAPANTNMARPPDPIGDVVRTINSGESGGADPYHELYGGGHFGFPQWSGAQGPQGTTHAAGAGQWEPGTWTQAAKFWMSQNPGKPPPDFNRPVDQYKVQRLWAIKTYGIDGNGNTLSKAAAAGKVDYGRLAGQWPSLKRLLPHNEQEQLAGADREREAGARNYQDASQRLKTLSQKIDEMDARSPGAARDLEHYRQAAEQAEYAAIQMQMHPPVAQPRDLMQKFGGLAMLVGILGGLRTKRPLIAALKAGSAAMDAYNAQDDAAFKFHLDVWKQQSDAMMKMAQFQQQMYKDTLDDERLSFGQKLDLLKAQATIAGDERTLAAAQIGDAHQIEQNYRNSQLLDARLLEIQSRMNNAEVKQTPIQRIYQDKLKEYRDAHDGANPPATVDQQMMTDAIKQQKQAQTEGTMPDELKFPEKGWDGMPDTPPPGVRKDVWDGALYYARTQHMPALGLGSSAAREQIYSALPAALFALGVPASQSADLVAAFAGERHGQVILGGRAGQLGLAINEARSLAPLGVQASEAVNRTEYPTLNTAIEAADRGVGDPNIVRLRNLTNALSNIAAQIAVRQGTSTDDARRTARSNLDEAYSKGQFATAVATMLQEAYVLMGAPRAAQQEVGQTFAPPGAGGGQPRGAISMQKIPPAALAALLREPWRREEFDKKFGVGSAAMVLGAPQ